MAFTGAQKKRSVSMENAESRVAEVLELREALRMLFDRVEEYAPSWYREDHHNKAEAALRFTTSDLSKS